MQFYLNWEKHQNEEGLSAIREYDRERKAIQRKKKRQLAGSVPDMSRKVRDTR